MEQAKKRKGLKIALWIMAMPIVLFFSLMALLYVPFIQQFISEQTARIASESTGMDIRVGRIDLRFKWADNTPGPGGDGDILDFYLHGDTAPDGRFLYRYFE